MNGKICELAGLAVGRTYHFVRKPTQDAGFYARVKTVCPGSRTSPDVVILETLSGDGIGRSMSHFVDALHRDYDVELAWDGAPGEHSAT